ncbi:hypothetical protein BCR43DRAFT_492965 [Syncephalastrum racemosum]|uniref:RRM domain-containing protein n=1 Tax=Syncephalastrum racemosum TaxID=13706 RepID=A0A1X2H9U2_SYNRA|nr:hypothetical protein BCR43DRAFT_492965 [Syncephalastrum racemosum]
MAEDSSFRSKYSTSRRIPMEEKEDPFDIDFHHEPPSPPGSPFVTWCGQDSDFTEEALEPSEDEQAVDPNVVVIKNIPLSMKQDNFIDFIGLLAMEQPCNLNYCYDRENMFHGTAFANFRTEKGAERAINVFTDFNLAGRKLVAEYKRIIPGKERDTRPMRPPHKINICRDRSFLDTDWRSPRAKSDSQRPFHTFSFDRPPTLARSHPVNEDVDLNDPVNLKIYNALLLFQNDPSRKTLTFDGRTAAERKAGHLLAEKLGLTHFSTGSVEDRILCVTKQKPNSVASRFNHASKFSFGAKHEVESEMPVYPPPRKSFIHKGPTLGTSSAAHMTPSKELREVQPLRDAANKNERGITFIAHEYASEYNSNRSCISDSDSDSECSRAGCEVAITYS